MCCGVRLVYWQTLHEKSFLPIHFWLGMDGLRLATQLGPRRPGIGGMLGGRCRLCVVRQSLTVGVAVSKAKKVTAS